MKKYYFKKMTAVSLALLLALGALAGCGGAAADTSESAEEPAESTETSEQEQKEEESSEEVTSAAEEELSGTLKMLSFTEYHDAVQASIDAFEEANQGVTIELEEYPFSQYSDAVEIKLGSQSSDYDIIMTDSPVVSSWAYQGWLAPVDEYFTEEEKAQYVSALVEAGTYEGSFYAPPLCNSCQVLFYNKDILDEAGIAYPSSDPDERLTWEEVADMGKKIMESCGDDGVYALTFEQVDRPYQVLPLANSAGADAFSPDGMSVDGYLNSTEFVKAMQFYSDIHNAYGIAPKGTSASETVGLFTAGQIGFICANVFDYATFEGVEGLNYGYAPFPAFADGKAATPTGSWQVSLSNFSENKDLAMQFIKYFTLGEGNDIFLETRGAFAAKVDALDAYENDEKYAEFPMDIFKLASYEAKNTAYPRPITVAYGEFDAIIQSTFADIRNGLDVEEALNSAVDQIETQLKIYE